MVKPTVVAIPVGNQLIIPGIFLLISLFFHSMTKLFTKNAMEFFVNRNALKRLNEEGGCVFRAKGR